MDCLFCRVAAKEVPATIVYEDEDIVAFKDIEPKAPQHFLIIPRQHIATLNDLEPQNAAIAGQLLLTAQHLAQQYAFATQGYRTIINCNTWGGQTVSHLHLHLLSGRQMTWPPG